MAPLPTDLVQLNVGVDPLGGWGVNPRDLRRRTVYSQCIRNYNLVVRPGPNLVKGRLCHGDLERTANGLGGDPTHENSLMLIADTKSHEHRLLARELRRRAPERFAPHPPPP